MAIAQFAGLASGIDSAELIDAIIESREAANVSRREQIDNLEAENSALDELNTMLLALHDLVDQLRTVNSGGLKHKVSSSDSDVLTASAGSDASNSTASITVSSLADTATASFDPSVAYTSTDDYLSSGAGTGTVSVLVGLGDDQVSIDVDVTGNSTTIDDYITAFNQDENAQGRVMASAINVGTEDSPEYRVVFNTLEQGTQKGTIAFSVDAVHTTQLGNQTVDQASNAEFTIGGITGSISRESNTISDVLPGVTMQFLSLGSADISVSEDGEATASIIGDIVDKFNEIVEYISDNDTISSVREDGQFKVLYGSLAQTSVDNDFLSEFRLTLAGAENSSTGAVQSSSELGITTERDGTLTFDEDVFLSAIGEDPTGAAELLADFADSSAGVSGFIRDYTKYQGIIDIAQDGNKAEIDLLNDAIEQLERRTTQEKDRLTATFARLESLSSELQATQETLTGILSSL